MFGTYDLDFNIQQDGIEIGVEGTGKRRHYYRKVNNEHIEKSIHSEKAKIIICPVEPVNVPDESMSEHLLIELAKTLIIPSGSHDSFFIKFPVEIGVFLIDSKDVERIDIFTKTKPKYTLYGPPERGIICKWWKSDFYYDECEVDPLLEGVMKIEIKNAYYEWMELNKVVFRAFDMKIFYNSHAYMQSYLTIHKRTIGETAFNARKPKKMHNAIDFYESKGLKKLEKKYLMEWGF